MTAEAKPHALIVSRNAVTAEGLRLYFSEHGVASSVTDQLDSTAGHDACTTVVVFPDEFPEQSAAVSIGVLARHFSRAWLVVVTRHRARFEELLAEINPGALDRLFILPRPVWGWALLDHVMQPPPLPLDP